MLILNLFATPIQNVDQLSLKESYIFSVGMSRYILSYVLTTQKDYTFLS